MKFFDDDGNEITELKGVDLGETSLNVPSELAQTLIAFRDSMKESSRSEYDTLKAQLDAIVKEKTLKDQEAEKIAREKEQLELAKNGELEALKQSLSTEWQDKITALEEERKQLTDKILDGEIKSTIGSIENVNRDAIDDIFLKIKTQNPTIVEDGIKVGEKALADVVKETVESKDYYRVVKSPVGTGDGVKPSENHPTEVKSAHEMIRDGLGTG